MFRDFLWPLVFLALGGLAAGGWYRYWQMRREAESRRRFTEWLLRDRESERNRIAGELHSNLGQNLLIMKNRAEFCLNTQPDSADALQQLREISALCSQTICESRRLAHNLHPQHLEQIGLAEALDAMVDRVAKATNIQFDRLIEPVDGVFEPEAAVHVYRIIQEALNNIMKHSGASKARVELIRDLKQVLLTIDDNGKGLKHPRTNGRSPAGVGVSEMEERARILGGDLELLPSPNGGTRLQARIPIRE
jgi:signal transduction histidine kinase